MRVMMKMKMKMKMKIWKTERLMVVTRCLHSS